MGDRVLKNAGRLTEAAILRNPVLQGIRNTVVKFATGFPLVQHKIADQLSEMDIGYPESPLTVKTGHVAHGPTSGERWPDRLPAGAAGAKFTAHGPAECVAILAAKFPQLVLAAPTGDPTHVTALRLIRPDGYVGFVCPERTCRRPKRTWPHWRPVRHSFATASAGGVSRAELSSRR